MIRTRPITSFLSFISDVNKNSSVRSFLLLSLFYRLERITDSDKMKKDK